MLYIESNITVWVEYNIRSQHKYNMAFINNRVNKLIIFSFMGYIIMDIIIYALA